VSGRATADLRKRFERPWLQYYGSHGLDRWHNDQVQVVQTAQEWSLPLMRMLSEFNPPDHSGVWVENKGITATVHYRLAKDPALMRERLREQLQPLCTRYGLILSEGRYIWEIKPPISLSKGTAVQALIEDCELDGVIFLGDDVTDLAAMASLRTLRDEERVKAVSVGVIHKDSEPATMRETCDITAYGPDDVARLLQWISRELSAQ
jgi:trehalose 6-phosphate phosphatase